MPKGKADDNPGLGRSLPTGQCWVAVPGVVLETEHWGRYRGDARQQRISGFRYRTYPSPTSVNTQPWSLGGDKGPQR